jgi:hypothetical protein
MSHFEEKEGGRGHWRFKRACFGIGGGEAAAAAAGDFWNVRMKEERKKRSKKGIATPFTDIYIFV